LSFCSLHKLPVEWYKQNLPALVNRLSHSAVAISDHQAEDSAAQIAQAAAKALRHAVGAD